MSEDRTILILIQMVNKGVCSIKRARMISQFLLEETWRNN